MVRVRFAPSPTGSLHVGGVRTALFNYLFAKEGKGGTFVLRIEDTDTLRSTLEYEEEIFRMLQWCGITPDEGPNEGGPYGPYRQMERVEKGVYAPYVSQLVENGSAYFTVYQSDQPEKELGDFASFPAALVEKGHPYTVKFRVPQQEVVFQDLLKGEMRFDASQYEDFIIQKSNGVPVYNFAVVVDDHLMEISHVFRGEDHLSNTPRQVLLYQALGWPVPVFMHIPLLLGQDRSPLSKRHGGTSVAFFRQEGYLHEGLMNYLALLGWAVDEEIFDPLSKEGFFSLDRISSRSVVFDYAKLEWVNGKQMRRKPLDALLHEYMEWLRFSALPGNPWRLDALERLPRTYVLGALAVSREKVNTFRVLEEFLDPFLQEDHLVEFSPTAWKKYLEHPDAQGMLFACRENLRELEEWNQNTVEDALRLTITQLGAGKKRFFQTLRVALFGKEVTPGLFESIEALGCGKAFARLDRVLEEVEKNV
ncbi:MAG TPA: glutamate--tRNA ligase [Thermotogota bacterium]|nr:glutamate--tRNA ligase [Thermotogota bacterium]HRW92142.1 glutamate--tRNA ligase [Thermotogota bacterium]